MSLSEIMQTSLRSNGSVTDARNLANIQNGHPASTPAKGLARSMLKLSTDVFGLQLKQCNFANAGIEGRLL